MASKTQLRSLLIVEKAIDMAYKIQQFDICIVCALAEEAEAVVNEFSDRCENIQFQQTFSQKNGYTYRYTTIKNSYEEALTVLVICMPFTGPVETALSVRSLLEEFHPRFVAMTGICAGYKEKVALGDLVAASYAFHYEEGKVEPDEHGQDKLRPEWRTHGTAQRIVQYINNFAAWKKPVTEMKQQMIGHELQDKEQPKCLIAPIASGMAVQGNDPFPRLLEHNRKALFLDQEVAAFYQTLDEFPDTYFLAAKGVCDHGDTSKNDDYHTFAAHVSAVYILYFVREYVTNATMPRRDHEQNQSRAGPHSGLNMHADQSQVHSPARLQIAGELSKAEALYRQRVALVYSHVQLVGTNYSDFGLGSSTLEHLFVPLTLMVLQRRLPDLPHGDFRTQLGMVNSPAKSRQQFAHQIFQQQEQLSHTQEPIALDKAMQTNLLIVGEPGAGKSTLFRWLMITFAQGLQRQVDRLGPGADGDRLPILIELGRLPLDLLHTDANKLPQWMQILPKYIIAQDAFSFLPSLFITQAIKDGRCLLLFDGLDEIVDRQVRIRIVQSLVNFATLYPGNRLLIGSRPAGSDEAEGLLGGGMKRCQIARFTSDDVKRFFHSWYTQDTTLSPQEQQAYAESLYTHLQETPNLLELATTPLLCTQLALIWHRNNASFPTRRVMIYEECCRVLIEKWERLHDISYQGAFSHLGWEQHVRLLQTLAFVIHERKQQHVGKHELLPILTQALLDEDLSPANKVIATQEAEKLLEIVSLRSGLLQYEGNDQYGFPHLAFQEFLAARYIALLSNQDHMIDLLMTHLHEAWWHEVWLLTISYLSTRAGWKERLSELFSSLLSVYRYPSWRWSLHMSNDALLRVIWKGWRFLRRDLECWLAGVFQRELELAVLGYLECVPGPHLARVEQLLLRKICVFAKRLLYDPSFEDHSHLLETIYASPLDVSSIVDLFGQSLWGSEIFQERAANNLAGATHRYPEVIPRLINALNSRPSDAPYALVNALCQVPSDHKEVLVLLQRVFPDLEHFSYSQIRAALHLFSYGVINEDIIGCLQYGLVFTGTRVADFITRGLALAFLENNKTLPQIWHVFTSVHPGSAVEKLLQDQQYRFAEILLYLIREDPSVIPELLSVAQQEDAAWRAHALQVLAVAASNHPEVQQLCLKLARQREKELWVNAPIGLRQLAAENAEVCNLLLELLHDPDPPVRQVAIASLHLAASKDCEVLNTLAGMLQDQHPGVCFGALYEVAELAPQHPTLSTALKELIQGKEFILDGELLTADQSLGLWFAWMEKEEFRAFFPIQDITTHHLLLQKLSDIDVKNTQRLIAQEYLAGAITQLIPGNEDVVWVLLKLLYKRKPLLGGDVLAELRKQCLNGLGKAATTNPLLFQKVLRSLSIELFERRYEDSTSTYKALEQHLHGRPLPSYRWLSLRVQRRRRRFFLFVISILLLALGTLLIFIVPIMLPFFLRAFSSPFILIFIIVVFTGLASWYNLTLIENAVLVFIRSRMVRKRNSKSPRGG